MGCTCRLHPVSHLCWHHPAPCDCDVIKWAERIGLLSQMNVHEDGWLPCLLYAWWCFGCTAHPVLSFFLLSDRWFSPSSCDHACKSLVLHSNTSKVQCPSWWLTETAAILLHLCFYWTGGELGQRFSATNFQNNSTCVSGCRSWSCLRKSELL